MGLHLIQSLLYTKENNQPMKTAYWLKKIFASCVSEEELISEICKDLFPTVHQWKSKKTGLKTGKKETTFQEDSNGQQVGEKT